MAATFVGYIDEAGDEGFGKLNAGPLGGQSRWLILGCCLVTRDADLKLPLWRDQILQRFPNKRARDLHFRHLNHQQKIVACQEIAARPIIACLTLSHKITIPGSRWEDVFKQKGYLYNYLLRWLLERVSHHCFNNDAHCSLKLVFSRRSNTDYQSMMDYLTLMRDGREAIRPVRSINWKVLDIDTIAVENHSKWAGLQIADCITSAFFSAVEPNVYGNYEPGYAQLLRGNLMTVNGRILNCGLTAVPSVFKSALDERQTAFFQSYR